jgi:hypothetical protein
MLIETQIPPVPGISDHGLMSGLGDDDHTQYLLADGSRIATELTIGAANDMYIYASGGNVHFYFDMGDAYFDVTSCLYVTGDLNCQDLEFTGTLWLDKSQGNKIISTGGGAVSVLGYMYNFDGYINASYEITANRLTAWSDLAVGGDCQVDGTVYADTALWVCDSAFGIMLNGADIEMWGMGNGDIVIMPYNYTVIYSLQAPNGVDISQGQNNTLTIQDQTGDMVFYNSSGGFFFDGMALQCTGGYISSDGNAGSTEEVYYSDGCMYFEDGLLVYVNIY